MTITILPSSSLTESEFYAKLRAFMVALEGNKTLPYYDTTN